MKEIQL